MQEHSHCSYCNEESDGPEHTVFQCPEWNEVRNKTNTKVGATVDANKVGEISCRDEESSKAVLDMLRSIMKVKAKNEIKMKRQQTGKDSRGKEMRRGFSEYIP
jgi:hypothetical protein